MLRKIKVVPLAAESLGVRSMCTYVETPSLRVLLDAGVSLCPNRFKLPPHPEEFRAIDAARKKIMKFAEKAEVITISHYHFDHHTPSFEDWLCNWTNPQTAEQTYEQKLVLAKSYSSHINPSQRRRGWIFKKTGGKAAKKIEYSDNRTFHFSKTKMKFSSPVFHGLPNTPLGWIIMTTIQHENEKMLFASDVQGPMDSSTVDVILAEKPDLLVVGGPPLYLADFRVEEQHIQRGLENLLKLVTNIPYTILEHHILRDSGWRNRTKQIHRLAQKTNHKISTAAEFLGEENLLLEARRKELFQKHQPSQDFQKWSKLPEIKRKRTKPPL